MKMQYDDKLKDFICYGDSELISVVDVRAHRDYKLEITFSNGEKRVYNALPLLKKRIYMPLKNVALFLVAKVEGGTVVWNDDIDISPEHLYEFSTAN